MSSVTNISKASIKEKWADKLVELGKFDSEKELMEEDYCFACGMKANTEKAHIVPRSKGGADKPKNLNLLCHNCHLASELIGDLGEYLEWLEQSGFMSSLLERAISREERISMGLMRFPEDYKCPRCGGRGLAFRNNNDNVDIYCSDCESKVVPENINS